MEEQLSKEAKEGWRFAANAARITEKTAGVSRIAYKLSFFKHSEGWTSRNEALLGAVLRRTRTTKHPWLIACDANMSPEDFEKSVWFRRDLIHVIAPAGVSTCRSKKRQRDGKGF